MDRVRRIGAALLLASLAAAEEPPDLAGVSAAMERREKASLPLRVAYRSTYTTPRGTFWAGCFEGWQYESAETSVRHVFTWEDRDQDPYTRGERRELVEIAPDLQLWRTKGGAWRGALVDVQHFGCPAYAGLGLRLRDTPLSRYVAAPSARAAGREKVGDFACLKVVVDNDLGATADHPWVFWLSERHGFLPVKMVHLTQADNERYAWKEETEVGGRAFKARSVMVVDELAEPAPGVWLPRRARVLAPFRYEAATVAWKVTDLRVGAIPDHMRALPELRDVPLVALHDGRKLIDVAWLSGAGAPSVVRRPDTRASWGRNIVFGGGIMLGVALVAWLAARLWMRGRRPPGPPESP